MLFCVCCGQQKGDKQMLTLYVTEIDNQIIMPREEFDLILEELNGNREIEVIWNDDLDYLTEEELKIREEAIRELERGETINFDDVKDKWLQGETGDV